MYGSSFDFSSVSLPGVGGNLNASNAVSTSQLEEMNKSGKKWRPGPDGMGLSSHNENILKANAEHRERRESLVNREYNENCDGKNALKEIFDRKKSRMTSFKEMKKNEYGFSEGDSQDSELLSMPLPGGAFKESCSCGTCNSCREKKRKDNEFREWNTEKRKALQEGKVKGSFAGPDMSFPIASPVDVAAAWASVGRASNPRAIMRRIIEIARQHNWTSGLPDSVKKRLAAGESGLPTE
jgi:hypothetical protein